MQDPLNCFIRFGGIFGLVFLNNGAGNVSTVNDEHYRYTIIHFFVPQFEDMLLKIFVYGFGNDNWPPQSYDSTTNNFFLWYFSEVPGLHQPAHSHSIIDSRNRTLSTKF